MQKISMDNCIKACWTCRDTCQRALIDRCLDAGGDHAEKEHVKLMVDCIQLCQTAADFMTRGSYHHAQVCAACAQVCEACGDSCEDLNGMQDCVRACQDCARECRRMSDEGAHRSAA